MASLTIGYWKIRGLAQPARMICGYNKAEFNDVTYECGDAPDYDRSAWTDVKSTLGLDFPNLPYVIDGDVKISQSNAVMRYLARKFNMEPQTEEEKHRLDIMENQAMDFRNGFVKLVYFTKAEMFDSKAKEYAENIAGLLGLFSKFLGSRKFFAGDKITFVDFIMYELLDQHRLFSNDLLKKGLISVGILDPFENLVTFLKEFEEIPAIKEFMASDKCFKGDINNKMAHFK